MSKRRITITVDETLLAAATSAVASGRAESVSSWVNEAVALRAERDARLTALGELVAAYEAEFGEITADELAQQEQTDRDAAAASRLDLRRAG